MFRGDTTVRFRPWGKTAVLATGKASWRACARTMEEHHWQPRDLLPGGFLVPSGTLAVLRLQQRGYAYFRP